MSKIRILHIFVLITAFIFSTTAVSCDPGSVSSSRSNPNDPSNPGYIPQPPDNISAAFLPDSTGYVDGRILVSWSNNSHHENGFLIERSYDGGDFLEVGNVKSRVMEWVDTDRDIRPGTRYRVTSYIVRDDEKVRHKTDAVPLDFGHIVFAWRPEFFLTPYSEFSFTIEKRKVYRDGLFVALVDPDGETEQLLVTEDDLEIVNIDSNLHTSHRIRIPYDDPVAHGSRIRVSWYILVDGESYVLGQVEQQVNVYS